MAVSTIRKSQSAFHAGFNHAGINLESKPDLRKRITTRLSEYACDAAPFLCERDRDLVLAVTMHGAKASDFAESFDMSPRQIRKHTRQLLRRIASPEFRLSLRLLLNKGAIAGSTARRNIARECFVNGLSIRDAAKKLGLTVHTVRSHATAIRNQSELMSAHTGERIAG